MLTSVVILMCVFTCTLAAPYNYYETYPQRIPVYPYGGANARLPSIGDLISGTNWFPLEINVPDVVGNVLNGITSIPATIFNGISGIVGFVQRLPIVNQIISQERPRPYLFVLPSGPTNDRSDNFNTFSDDIDVFAQYP